jgi:serine protease
MIIASALALNASAAPFVTAKCNSDFSQGGLAIRVQGNILPAADLLAIVTDPKRDPELYDRLWRPNGGELPEYLPTFVKLKYDWLQDTGEIAARIKADTVLRARGVLDAMVDSWGCFAAPAPAWPITVTEFHNRFLDHYFLSSSEAETRLIDDGFAGEGWERTGEGFAAIASDYCYGSYPVFRFYGASANSHFFTVDPQECGQVRKDPGWGFEGNAFGAEPPANGMCGLGTQPVYRVYNNRWMFNDTNHRFVTRLDLYEAMKMRGWVGEGVQFCVRQW